MSLFNLHDFAAYFYYWHISEHPSYPILLFYPLSHNLNPPIAIKMSYHYIFIELDVLRTNETSPLSIRAQGNSPIMQSNEQATVDTPAREKAQKGRELNLTSKYDLIIGRKVRLVQRNM